MNTPAKEYTLTLPVAAMEMVMTAVAELPYRIAHPLMQQAETQFSQQHRAEEPAPPAA
ncbi:hypothetical protein [Paraburkholderia sp. D1E]|uniref:hypothetical protein n=1 Tax=Paraburkholderia sp. D1E TaxID=3461398 RepID=UPI0040456FD7